jgi:cytochrome P450
MSLINMHRNTKYWGHDAHLFRPERFEGELKNPRAYAPFTGEF